MGTKIDQKAYLQKYLAGPSNDKKKKKKKVVKGKGLKIIDDDVDLSKLRPLDGDELDILDQGEDAPQIAGIIDERPEEVKKAELFNMSSKWRVINQDDGFNSKLQIEEIKKDVKQQEKENELIFGKMYSDSEDEQPKPTNSDVNKQSKRQSDKSDSDFSPPRRGDNRESPPNTRRDSDQSPPRRKENRKERTRPSRWGDAEQSRRTPDSDLSPPRKSRKHNSVSPEKHKSNKNRLAESPHTKQIHKRNKNIDVNSNSDTERHRNGSSKKDSKRSDKHKRKGIIRKDSDSDLSPPRKNKRDISPAPKKNKVHSLERKYNDSDSDLSPPRRDRAKNSRRNSSSPDRRNNEARSSKKYYESPNRNSNKYADKRRDNSTKDKRKYSESPPPSNKKMARTLEGKMAGLQDARQLREENEAFRRREEDAFKRLGDEVSGRNARAVARKSKRDTSEERRKQMEKAERQKEIDEKYKKWGKGLKQIEAQEARVQDFIHEASKPLARYKDDEDLEQRLKNEERQGDPMLKYVKDKKRERGELGPEKPSYKGSFPPNRFNIRPGYRWDGVDRSNGYEKKYFEQQSKRKAQEEEAYKWSTEDL